MGPMICNSVDICPHAKSSNAYCDHMAQHEVCRGCAALCDLINGVHGAHCKPIETKWDE